MTTREKIANNLRKLCENSDCGPPKLNYLKPVREWTVAVERTKNGLGYVFGHGRTLYQASKDAVEWLDEKMSSISK